MNADDAFAEIAAPLLADLTVSEGKMFGSIGLKTSGKVFAMLVKHELVVKLPAERCATLVRAGRAHPFDPGHGRLMKEWIAIPQQAVDQWAALTREAHEYVAARGSKPARRVETR